MVCEEVKCNCDKNTNTDSNSSDTTTQPTQPATTYTPTNLKGTSKFETDAYTIIYVLLDNGLFVEHGHFKNVGDTNTYGNYIAENNKIKLHEMFQLGIGGFTVDKVVKVNIVSADTIY